MTGLQRLRSACAGCRRRDRRLAAGRCRACRLAHPRTVDPPAVVLDAAVLAAQPDSRARVAGWLTGLGVDPASTARVEVHARVARVYPAAGQPYTIALPERAA